MESIAFRFSKMENGVLIFWNMEREKEKTGIQIEVAHEIKGDTIASIKKHLNAEKLPEVVKIKKVEKTEKVTKAKKTKTK